MEEFIASFIAPSDSAWSHMRNGIRYFINRENLDTFYDLYEQEIESENSTPCIAERLPYRSPIIGEVTLKGDEPVDNSVLRLLGRIYQEVSSEITSKPIDKRCVVLKTPFYNGKEDIRFLFPYEIVDKTTLCTIRSAVIDIIIKLRKNKNRGDLPKLSMPNPMESIRDIAIEAVTMYGSSPSPLIPPKEVVFGIDEEGDIVKPSEIVSRPYHYNLSLHHIVEENDHDGDDIDNSVFDQAKDLMGMVSTKRLENSIELADFCYFIYKLVDGRKSGLKSILELKGIKKKTIIGLWDKYEVGWVAGSTFTINTLKWWARKDSPGKYKKWIEEQQEQLLFATIGKYGSDADIVNLLHFLYPNLYTVDINNNWFSFDGQIWEEDIEHVRFKETIMQLVPLYKSLLTKIDLMVLRASEAEDDNTVLSLSEYSKSAEKLIQRLGSDSKKAAIIREAIRVYQDREWFNKKDKNKFLFGWQNGVYDLRMKGLRDYRPEDYITKRSPIQLRLDRYTWGHPRVKQAKKFMKQVFVDREIREYMWNLLSRLFDKLNKGKEIIIWQGPKANNAKSTLEYVIRSVFGSYAGIIDQQVLMKNRNSNAGPSPELMGCIDTNVVFADELTSEEFFAIAKLKKLTSGKDLMPLRNMREKKMTVCTISYKLIFVTNELPRVPSNDAGFYNRLRIILFESIFVDPEDAPENEDEQFESRIFPKDNNFDDKLNNLLEAFAWILIQYYNENDGKEIHVPEKVKETVNSYRTENDPYTQFFEKEVESSDDTLRFLEAYDSFCEWFKWAYPGHTPPHGKKFEKEFSKLAGEFDKKKERWNGYRIRGAISRK